MPGFLEMEEEETESLVRETRGGNAAAATTSSTAKGNSITSKRSTTLVGLSAAVALLLLFLTTNSNTTTTKDGDVTHHASNGGLVDPLPGHMEEKTQSQHTTEDDSTPTTTSNSAGDTTTSSSSSSSTATDPSKSAQEEQPFVYSKMATIPPDPYQRTHRDATPSLGSWHFWDGDENIRPTTYRPSLYPPYGDIPGDDFPLDAWQTDAVFVNHLLNDAEQLVTRAKEAILMEYGHGKDGITAPEQLRERLQMFHWDTVETLQDAAIAAPPPAFAKRGGRGNGGWMTPEAKEGLVQRLLHAAMTNQPFVVVMGGHSAAAGHGNHFHQSYLMQFHKVVAPVLARLGVQLKTRNMAQGGLGTLHNALGMGDLYGSDIDWLLWDSGMTEKESAHLELFARQAVLGGNSKVPVIMGLHFHVLQQLYAEMGFKEVGEYGNGHDGMPIAESAAQAAALPHAVRYWTCGSEAKDLCEDGAGPDHAKYCTHCWINRPDVDAETAFWDLSDHPSGQVKWHPGWRSHQVQGRVLAFALLDALQVAIQAWSDGTMGGPPLDDDWWHVTDHFQQLKDKMRANNGGACQAVAPSLPARVCTTAMHARTQYTPRHDPDNTSITSIVVPAADGTRPENKVRQVYTGPDVENQCFQIPDDAVDVLGIVSNRRRRLTAAEENEMLSSIASSSPPLANTSSASSTLRPRHLAQGVVPGKGWQVVKEPPGHCDGEYASSCGRAPSDKCPLLGHHDGRGALLGNEYSGWLVMDLPNVKEGLVILKIFTWLDPKEQTLTQGWKKVNMEGPTLDYVDEDAKAVKDLDELPDTFRFEYSIEGKITSLTKTQLKEQRTKPQRVMEILTILDDPSYGAKDSLQVGLRMIGCGRFCTFGLSHIYWA